MENFKLLVFTASKWILEKKRQALLGLLQMEVIFRLIASNSLKTTAMVPQVASLRVVQKR